MKLLIKDISWGIDRRNGNYGESEVENKTFDIKEGDVVAVGKGPVQKEFKILKVTDDMVVVELNSKGQKAEIAKGTKYIHRPISFDGGHYYILEVL